MKNEKDQGVRISARITKEQDDALRTEKKKKGRPISVIIRHLLAKHYGIKE